MAETTFEEAQKRRGEIRKEYGQRIADLPKVEEDLRKKIFGTETIIPALTAQKDAAIKELWETDKMLADRYANPESEMFIEDPYKRESLVAGRHQDIFQNVAALTRAEEARRDTLGDILERGVKIFELGLTALEKEHGFLGSEIDDLLKKAAMEETKATKGKKETEEKTIANAINTLLSAGIDISNPLDVYQSAVELGIDPTLIPSIVSNISGITSKPGVPAGGYELTDEEIAAGVETFDPKEVRNKKVTQYLKDRDDPVKQMQKLKDEGYSKKDVENYIKRKEGIISPPLQNAINQVYGEEENKDFIPDWIPFLGKL